MQLKGWKVFTSLMLLGCVALLVGWPYLVGDRPGPTASVIQGKAYAVKFVSYIGAIVLLLILAAVGAIVIMRRTAAEFRAQQRQLMRELIEGTLQDQRAKSDAAKLD